MDGFWIPKFKAGTFFGSLSPAVARIMIEELRQARYKKTQLVNVLGVLRLLWSKWRRNIFKSADLIIEIPAGCGEIRPRDMHETLMLVIYFPYLNMYPWELWKIKLLVGMVRYRRSVFKMDYCLGGCVLSQLFKQTRGMDTLPFCQLHKLLSRGANPTFPSQ